MSRKLWKSPQQGGSIDLELDKDEVETLYTEGELVKLSEDKKLVFIKVKTHCPVCNDSGAILTWNSKENRTEVQKCDECNKYATDYLAWMGVQPPQPPNPYEDLDDLDLSELDSELKEDFEREWL